MVDEPEAVVVFSAPNVTEAQLACGALESAGIEATVLEENLTAYNVVMAQATRAVRVIARASQEEEALDVLREGGFIRQDLIDEPEPEEGAQVCPNKKCLHWVPFLKPVCAFCGTPVRWDDNTPRYRKQWRPPGT